MLTRREFLRGATVAGVAASLPLRGNEDTAEERVLARAREVAAEGAKLELLIPKGASANVLPVATAFEAATAVAVSLREVPVDDVASHVLLESAAGRASFDIALPPTFGIPDLVESGALRPLDDFVERHEAAHLGTGSLYALGDRYKGRFYGYQTDGDVYVLFYNRDILEDAGLRAAYEDRFGVAFEIPTTWEELDRQMEFVHDPERGRFGGTLFRKPGYIEWEWWIRLHAKGMLPVDDEMRPRFEGSEGVAALDELIRASSWQTPASASQGLFDNWKDFGSGHAYCNVGWGGTQKYLNGPRSELRGKLRFGPTPGGVVADRAFDVSYFNWGWNYVVASGSAAPELAYLFTLYASLPGPSTRSVRAADGFFDPHRIEHYEDEVIEEVYSREFLEQHRSSMSSCIPDFYVQGRDEYFAVLGRYLGRANRGEISSERALLLAARGWDLITDRLGREGQIEQWSHLKESYPRSVLEAASGR